MIVDAFKEGSTPSELSRFLRTSLYRKPSDLFDGRGNSDKIYKSILEKIGRFKKEWRAGNYDHLVNHIPIKDMTTRVRMQYNSAMKSRTVKINARGLHVLNEHYAIEKKLIAKLEELWENDKCVSRTVVFRLVLEIDPDFLVSGGQGGRGSTGHLDRLKTWFYHGFKKRFNLSNRKIASIGQKLPDKWREKLRTQQQRVAAAQFPQEVDLGNGEKVNVPGIDDKDWYNFDHVPVWQEPVRTYSWGKKDSGRRNVKTAGREKNRYTVVLGITMWGEKCRPLIIFKGMFAFCA